MGNSGSQERTFYMQVLRVMIKAQGCPIKSHQLAEFLNFVNETCPWFSEEGILNLDTWEKVEKQLRTRYTNEGPDKIPMSTFTL